MIATVRLALVTFLTLGLVACGGPTAQAPAPTAQAPAPTESPEPTTLAPITEPVDTDPNATATYAVEVKMGADSGKLIYEPAQINAKPGDKIKWIMNKAGPHNVVFDVKTSADSKTAEAMTQKKLINKKNDFLVTTIPADAPPGAYNFVCVPHKAAGMIGTLIIS